MIYDFLFCIILTEAITEIIVKSNLFIPIRKYFFERRNNKLSNWIHDLLDCGYCTSVWIGWFTAILFLDYINIVDGYVEWFFLGLVVHRLSNVLHDILDIIYRGKEINFSGQG